MYVSMSVSILINMCNRVQLWSCLSVCEHLQMLNVVSKFSRMGEFSQQTRAQTRCWPFWWILVTYSDAVAQPQPFRSAAAWVHMCGTTFADLQDVCKLRTCNADNVGHNATKMEWWASKTKQANAKDNFAIKVVGSKADLCKLQKRGLILNRLKTAEFSAFAFTVFGC